MPSIRKFGTPLHNIPKKNGKASPQLTTQFKPIKATSPAFIPTITVHTVEQAVKEAELRSEDKTLDIDHDPEQQPTYNSKALHYDIQFLLSFSNIAAPVPVVLPEIVRGYKHPEPVAVASRPATIAKSMVRAPNRDLSGAKTLDFTTPAKINNRVLGCATAPATHSRPTMARYDLDSVARSLDLSEDDVKKKEKKVKPRETDSKRLQARRKQLDIGMNTEGYKAWLQQVPPERRNIAGPRIPDVFQVCSKRSWDGQVRKWRRELHAFDPQGLPLPAHLAEEVDSGEVSDE